MLEKSDYAKKKIARLGELADLTKKAWIKHDRQAVGQIFNEAQEILHSFFLSGDIYLWCEFVLLRQLNRGLGYPHEK